MPPGHCLFDGFLKTERALLLDFILRREGDFHAATVSLGAKREVVEGVRRARILEIQSKLEEVFLPRLRSHLKIALESLGYADFTPARIEAQVTASNDGDYFRLHTDGGYDDTREITFVYFLHNEPRPFSGGELCIQSCSVTPAGDTIVFFPSIVPHEVLPVHVPTGAFADSRFTVNGWIHKDRVRKPSNKIG